MSQNLTPKPNTVTQSALYIEQCAYRCDTCSTKFNWDSNSRNASTYDPGKPLPTFCCPGCAATWKKQQTESKKLEKANKP